MKTRFSDVKRIDRNEITVLPKLFQNRTADFSQSSVDKIVREGFDVNQDPIVVWFDERIGKYVVLSGHSRWEASKQLLEKQPELAQMPVREFLGNFEEASYFANVESNRQGEAEGLRGDLQAYKRVLAEGCVSTECLKGVFKSNSKIRKLQDLSHLNINGRFIEELDKENTGVFPNLELYARWTGDLRETFPQITDSHENEIFSWLYAGKEGGTNFLPVKEDFYRLLENKVNNFGFVASEPLNLKNSVRRTAYESQADEQMAEIKRDIKTLEERNNQLNGLMQRGLEKEKDGLGLPRNYAEWEAEFSRNNRAINKRKLQIADIQDKVKTLNVRDLDLFAQPSAPEPKKDEPKAEEPILPTRNINQLEPYELTFDEFVERYKKYKGKDFRIGKTQVTYVPKTDTYKMQYALPTGMQTYTGELYEVMRKAYNNVIERAQKQDKLPPAQENNLPTEPQTKEEKFIQKIQANIADCEAGKGKPFDKTKRGKIGEELGITLQKEVKELTELAIVMYARGIATREGLSLSEKYGKIVGIYECQPVISEQDSTSKSAQQYSTPIPIAFLAGEFTKMPKTESVYEPSSGNGLLTVAYPADMVHVNELDKERLASLQLQDFAQVTNYNGAEPFPTSWRKTFDAVLTNPPFGTTNKTKAVNYELTGLEHIMAHYALQTMRDQGRCAIIIGGHAKYDDKGRPTQGKERSFTYYLYTYYNVIDIINIDGAKLYRRQGTSFPIRLILIDGRKAEEKLVLPPVQDTIVDTFEDLYNKVLPYLNYNGTDNNLLQPRIYPDLLASVDLGNRDTEASGDRNGERFGDVLGEREAYTLDTEGEGRKNEPIGISERGIGDNSGEYHDSTSDIDGDNGLRHGATPHRSDESIKDVFGLGQTERERERGHRNTFTDRGGKDVSKHDFGANDNGNDAKLRLLHTVMAESKEQQDEGLKPRL